MVFIYALEEASERGDVSRSWLDRIDSGEVWGVTSELSLAEVLPIPLATPNLPLIDSYMDLLADRPDLRVSAVTQVILLQVAELRADLRLRTPDAIHVATALAAGCDGFVNGDDRLKLPDGLTRIRLSQAPA